MISSIFSTITEVVTSFASALGNVFSGLGDLFFTTSGSTTTPTMLGTLLLISAGVGLVYFGFRMIRKLVHSA